VGWHCSHLLGADFALDHLGVGGVVEQVGPVLRCQPGGEQPPARPGLKPDKQRVGGEVFVDGQHIEIDRCHDLERRFLGINADKSLYRVATPYGVKIPVSASGGRARVFLFPGARVRQAGGGAARDAVYFLAAARP
jgi:hypothetical protein